VVPLLLLHAGAVFAAGTPAGTVINNVAEVTFDLNGTTATQASNIASITVVEKIDVVVTQNGQVLVTAGDRDRSLLFTVTNIGNGVETFNLVLDSTLTGDDFDPTPAVPAIYFDSDASGDFNAGDIAYTPGSNDPVLAADSSVNILLVNDISGAALNGQVGRSELAASAVTGSGNPGDAFAGQGDGGVNAVLGTSGGQAAQFGEYLVSDVQLNLLKSVLIDDQFGTQEPIPGATLTYTVTVEVTNAGSASNAMFNDVIPPGTTYVPASITLNKVSLTDANDADVGELDTSGAPMVVIRFGDLAQSNGLQTVEFQVTID